MDVVGSSDSDGPGDCDSVDDDIDSSRLVDVDQRRPLLRRVSSGGETPCQGRQAIEYLHGLDSDVRDVVSAFTALRTSGNEIDASVTCRRQRHGSLTMWGVDCGVRWSTAIALMVLVGVAVPAFLTVYFLFFHSSS